MPGGFFLDRYHLYLDESVSNNGIRGAGKREAICVAGIIVKEDNITPMEQELNNLKRVLWSDQPKPEDIILHELEVKTAQKRNSQRPVDPLYRRFHVRRFNIQLYQGISGILNTMDCKIIGASIEKFEMNKYFTVGLDTPDYLVTFQIILENFCHFLHSVNGVGEVYYESQNETVDARLRKHYNQVKSNGSMFINAEKMQKHLREIEFPGKKENIAGLQVADFVPNYFARKALKLNPHRYNINDVLRRRRYDGCIYKMDRFGVKQMP